MRYYLFGLATKAEMKELKSKEYVAIVARTRNNVQVNRLFALHDTRVAV